VKTQSWENQKKSQIKKQLKKKGRPKTPGQSRSGAGSMTKRKDTPINGKKNFSKNARE